LVEEEAFLSREGGREGGLGGTSSFFFSGEVVVLVEGGGLEGGRGAL